MSITQKLVTTNLNVDLAKGFISSFSNTSSSGYYMFFGKHVPYGAPQTNDPDAADAFGDDVEVPSNSDDYITTRIYDDMIFAKKITDRDVKLMIDNNIWQSNTVYEQYDSTVDLSGSTFFVTVDDLTEYNVYKCLFNNYGAPSTAQPYRNGNIADRDPFITADQYVWKYMFTVSKADYEKFATNNFLPLTPNTDIIENARPGTIEAIKIIDGGQRYDNWYVGTFTSGDIEYAGAPNFFALGDNASAIPDYYQSCVMKITNSSVAGAAGQYRKIVNYEADVFGKKVAQLDSPFDVTPAVGDEYEIYPYVFIWGDGSESSDAEARAIVSEISGNSIVRIEMLSPGSGYRSAKAKFIIPSDISDAEAAPTDLSTAVTGSVNFRAANLVPIISPAAGHGSNPAEELFARRVCVSVKVNQTEDGTIPANNDFRTIGIIKDPEFTNVDLLLDSANTIGLFTVGETVVQYDRLKLYGTVEAQVGNNTFMKTNGGKISTTIAIEAAGSLYNSTVNNQIVFDNTGTQGIDATATFTNNAVGAITTVTVTSQGSDYVLAPTAIPSPQGTVWDYNVAFNASANVSSADDFITLTGHLFNDGDEVQYLVDAGNTAISGLANNTTYYVVSSNSSGIKLSTSAGGSAIDITSGSAESGHHVVKYSVTGSGAVLAVSLANPAETFFNDSLNIGDYVLVSTSTHNFVSKVLNPISEIEFVTEEGCSFTAADADVSLVKITAMGTVSANSTGQISANAVSGVFKLGGKLLGLSSRASSTIKTTSEGANPIEINDKNPKGFNTILQLTRLNGNFASGSSPFIDDERIYQTHLIKYIQPAGRLHSKTINDGLDNDVLFISREYGIFNRDPDFVRPVIGDNSDAAFKLLSKYPGDFVKDSGKVLYLENLDAINRSGNKSEIAKIILEF